MKLIRAFNKTAFATFNIRPSGQGKYRTMPKYMSIIINAKCMSFIIECFSNISDSIEINETHTFIILLPPRVSAS